jgi:hypothetical protein
MLVTDLSERHVALMFDEELEEEPKTKKGRSPKGMAKNDDDDDDDDKPAEFTISVCLSASSRVLAKQVDLAQLTEVILDGV